MKFTKWLTFNRIPARWLALGIVFLFVSSLRIIDVPLVVLAVIYLGSMPFLYIFIDVLPPFILQQNELIPFFEKCDPFPLLRISEKLLSSNISTVARRNLTVNYCIALRGIGEYEKAYEALKGLNIEDFPARMNLNKLILYNNLADLCFLLEKYDEVLEYHEKFEAIYNSLKMEKLDPAFQNAANSLCIDRLYINGDYLGALELMRNQKPTHLESRINTAFYYAKIYIKLGDKENAKENLNYVIENGNRLFAVVEARRMLEVLESES